MDFLFKRYIISKLIKLISVGLDFKLKADDFVPAKTTKRLD